jgi:hypothetical protein
MGKWSVTGTDQEWLFAIQQSTGKLAFNAGISGTSIYGGVVQAGLVPNGSWSHVAACQSGTTLRLFIDGSIVATGTRSGSVPSAGGQFTIGLNLQGLANDTFGGNIDELRVTKGVARYTAAFSPPTLALPPYQ